MRFMPLLLLVLACDKDPKQQVDAAIQIVDSKPIDAAIDAPPDASPDATPMNIVTACDHLCAALAVCFMEPANPMCNTECATDLADCTAQQVTTLDACSTEMCGDITVNMSPILNCITAVPCVDTGGMLANVRK